MTLGLCCKQNTNSAFVMEYLNIEEGLFVYMSIIRVLKPSNQREKGLPQCEFGNYKKVLLMLFDAI